MKTIVTIKTILPVQTIQSKDGSKTWQKQDFIGTDNSNEKYPKDICFTIFGDERVSAFTGYSSGDKVEVEFDIQSREYNGSWYTSINIWSIKRIAEQATIASAPESQDDLPW